MSKERVQVALGCGWGGADLIGAGASYRSPIISYVTCFGFPLRSFFTPIKLERRKASFDTISAFPLSRKSALKARMPIKAPLRTIAANKGPLFFIFPRPSMSARFASTLKPTLMRPLSLAEMSKSEKSVIFHLRARLRMNVQSLSAMSVLSAASSEFTVLAWMNLLYKTSDSFLGDVLMGKKRQFFNWKWVQGVGIFLKNLLNLNFCCKINFLIIKSSKNVARGGNFF